MGESHKAGCRRGCGFVFLFLVLAILGPLLLSVVAARWGLEGNEVAYLAAGFIAALLIPALALVVGLGLGVLWSPFAALISARVARTRGLESHRYALAGAVYSILFFWPWVYLIARMNGKVVPVSVIRGTYVFLYAVIWPSSALSFVPLAFSPQPFGIVSLLLLLLNCLSLVMSAQRLIKWNNRFGNARDKPSDELLPHREYILPFVYVLSWIIVTVCFWALSGFRTA